MRKNLTAPKTGFFKGADDFALMRFLNFGASAASGRKFIAPHFYPNACDDKMRKTRRRRAVNKDSILNLFRFLLFYLLNFSKTGFAFL